MTSAIRAYALISSTRTRMMDMAKMVPGAIDRSGSLSDQPSKLATVKGKSRLQTRKRRRKSWRYVNQVVDGSIPSRLTTPVFAEQFYFRNMPRMDADLTSGN